MAQSVQTTGFGTLGQICRRKLTNDNDVKIIVVGKNSQTGIGKTTLAIQLCRFIDRNGWSADEKAFIDVHDYIQAHLDKQKGSCLLMDEIEAGADNRRAMSHENVELSQAWATMRARNIATVTTAPSISMVDSRMLELADFWILVKRRGWAQPFEINVNDFNGRVQRSPIMGGEHIKFADLPDDDADKEYLDSIKDDMLRGKGESYIKESECQERVEKVRKECTQELRDELIREAYNEFDVTYKDLGELDAIDLTPQAIGEIVRNG